MKIYAPIPSAFLETQVCLTPLVNNLISHSVASWKSWELQKEGLLLDGIFKLSYCDPEQAQRKEELAEIYKNTPKMNIMPFLCP